MLVKITANEPLTIHQSIKLMNLKKQKAKFT